MKILMVHPHDLNSRDEPWTVRMKYLAREIQKKRNNVKVVYFSSPGKQRENYCRNEWGIEEFTLKRSRSFFLKNVYKIFKLAKDVDLIHFQKCHDYASLPCLVAGTFINKPIHYDWDDWETKIYTSFSITSKVAYHRLNTFERNIPHLVDTVSVASKGLKGLCLELGVREERIFDSPVGADLDKFNPTISGAEIRKKYNLNNLTVLYLGQLHSAQYADLFIKTAKLILDEKMEANFMIVGDGIQLPGLRALAHNLGLDEKIVFTGAVEHNSVPQYIAASDIAVACFEDNEVTRCKSPLKVVEYMASGKPIVASSVGEVKNMVDGCGILTKPGSINELAGGIEMLLRDENLRIDLSRKARKRAQEMYNWSKSADNLLKAYDAAIRLNSSRKEKKRPFSHYRD